MKRILLGIMGIVGMFCLSACDKVDEGEFTVYDGAVVSWNDSETSPTVVQRAYVEKYTGPRCSNCPTADVTLAAIHDNRVVMVSVNHPTGQGMPYPNQPDMRTDGGTAWDNYFGINAIPAAYLNRDKGTQYLGDMANIMSDINRALADDPTVALDVESYYSSGKVSIKATLQFVKEYRDKVTLTAALIEDSLVYRQLMPDNSIDDNYEHNHMLRKVITGFWGRDVEATGAKDECLTGSLSFSPDNSINLANSHIVVFISDKATRQVLNCASCKINIEE